MTRTSKELRGETDDAKRSVYSLEREINRSYYDDPIGKSYCQSLLRDFKRLLEHLEEPLNEAVDFEGKCDLRGSHRKQLDAINKVFAALGPRKEELERLENITQFEDHRKKGA
jgi:hypothetical protein